MNNSTWEHKRGLPAQVVEGYGGEEATGESAQRQGRHYRFKGSVQRKLRPMFLYIIQKLFSRPIIIAVHKISILLKGQFTINKKQFSVSKAGSYHIV